MFFQVLCIGLLQGLRDPMMETLTPNNARDMVEHLADKGVRELKGLILAHEQVVPHTLFQQAEQRLLTLTAYRHQHVKRKTLAQACRQCQEGLARPTEVLYALSNSAGDFLR